MIQLFLRYISCFLTLWIVSPWQGVAASDEENQYPLYSPRAFGEDDDSSSGETVDMSEYLAKQKTQSPMPEDAIVQVQSPRDQDPALEGSAYYDLLDFQTSLTMDSANNDSRSVLRSFFSNVLNEPGAVEPPRELLEISEWIYEAFKEPESFMEEQPEPSTPLRNGFLTFRFKMPEKYNYHFLNLLDGYFTKYTMPVYVKPHIHDRNKYLYDSGFLAGVLSANRDAGTLDFRIQIYWTKREPSLLWNLNNYTLPSASSHLILRDLGRYLCHGLHGIMVEWFILALYNAELAEHPLSLLMRNNIGSFLRQQQTILSIKWEEVRQALRKFNSNYNLKPIRLLHTSAHNATSTLSSLLSQIEAYNTQVKPMLEFFEAHKTRIRQLQLLQGEPCFETMFALFTGKSASEVSSIDFVFGNDNMHIFFKRLRSYTPRNFLLACKALSAMRFSLIPRLIAEKDEGFIEQYRTADVDEFVAQQLFTLWNRLNQIKGQICELVPTHPFVPEDIVINKVQMPVVPMALNAASNRDVVDFSSRLENVLLNDDLRRVCSKLKLLEYLPRLIETDISICVAFTGTSVIFIECMSECRNIFPDYKPKGASNIYSLTCLDDSYSKEFEAYCIQFEPKLSPVRRSTLETVWLKYFFRQISMEVWSKNLRVEEELLKISEILNNELIEKLYQLEVLRPEATDVSSGYNGFNQTHLDTSGKLMAYLEFMEKLPKEVSEFVVFPEANARLFSYSKELISTPIFDVMQPGLIQFIAKNHDKLSPSLLNIFAKCYLVQYRNSSLPHPFGEKDNPQLAGFLGELLMITVNEGSHKQASESLDDYFSVLKTTLNTMQEFDLTVVKKITDDN
jgi:hypothetical protein